MASGHHNKYERRQIRPLSHPERVTVRPAAASQRVPELLAHLCADVDDLKGLTLAQASSPTTLKSLIEGKGPGRPEHRRSASCSRSRAKQGRCQRRGVRSAVAISTTGAIKALADGPRAGGLDF